MGSGTARTKVTITLEDEQLAALRKLVASGKAESVSGFYVFVSAKLAT